MIELAMVIATVLVMARIAEMGRRSGLAWGAINLVVCLACVFLIPLPLLRVLIGFAVVFLAMFAANIAQRKS